MLRGGRRAAAVLLPALLAGGCSGTGGSAGTGGAVAVGDDEAERLYQEGLTWARKAQTAPLPTPEPPTRPLPAGAPPPAAPEFKPEELRAVELFEQTLATRPDHAGASLAMADLLAPHAIRRVEGARAERERLAAMAARRRRRAAPTAPPPTAPPAPIDASPERVARAYEAAMRADPGRAPVERMIAFALAVGRLDAAEAGYQELLKRVRESAEPYVLYGDFLAARKKDFDGAIEQYRQALIWKPDDDVTRRKVANIYLDRGAEYYRAQQYALAAAEFRASERYISDRDSEEGKRLRQYQQRMREIRAR